jgi:hypothetical protein
LGGGIPAKHAIHGKRMRKFRLWDKVENFCWGHYCQPNYSFTIHPRNEEFQVVRFRVYGGAANAAKQNYSFAIHPHE